MKKVTDITYVLVGIFLMLSNILFDNNNIYYRYVQASGLIITIIYFVIRIFKKRTIKLIKNKLDVFMCVLTFSTVIPVLTNTYVTLYGSISMILQYMYALAIYFLLREMSQESPKLVQCIYNIFIITIVLLIFIGIDAMTTQLLSDVLEKINIRILQNGENRLATVVGYPNTIAALVASAMFLNLYQSLKVTKYEIKSIYQMVNTIFIIAIILTYSKGIFLILPLILVIYLFALRNKKMALEIIKSLFVSLCISIVFLLIYDKAIIVQNYTVMWLALIVATISSYVINLLIEKLEIDIENIKLKKVFTLIGISLALILTYVIIGLNVYDEFVVFSKNTQTDYNAKILNKIKGNEEYSFEFYIESQLPGNLEDGFEINLLERDKNNKEIKNTRMSLGTYSGVKEIKLTTNENTREIKIEFKSEYKYIEKTFVIKKLLVNGREVPLNYKLLPTKLVEKIKNISLNYKTARERMEMINNSLELAKDNLITGIGGYGWHYRYKEVQNYNYNSTRLHCYPAKVILEMGLLGLLAYLAIIFMLIKLLINLIKNKNIEGVSILFSILTVGLHSVIDLDMEYTHILIYMFGLIGIVCNNFNSNKEKNTSILPNIAYIIILTVCTYFVINDNLYNNYEKITEFKKAQKGLYTNSEEYKKIDAQMAEVYKKITKYERHGYINAYKFVILYYINNELPESEETIRQYCDYLLEYENKIMHDEKRIIEKIEAMYSIVYRLNSINDTKYNEIREKLINKIIEEYPPTKESLKECLLAMYKNEKASTFVRLENIYENTLKIKKRYLLGVRIINNSEVEIEEEQLKNLQVKLNKSLLIYHTHASESYRANQKYETYEFYKTLDDNYNVISLGKHLKQILVNDGFLVEHDSKHYDLPSVKGAYDRSKEGVEYKISQNSNFCMILDLHRDAISEVEHKADMIKYNGKEMALLRFVIGIDLTDPDWMYDLKLAIEIQNKANEIYPGLFKPILIRETDYNQNVSKYAMLLEVGENCNTLEQAKNSVEAFAEILTLLELY